MRASLVNVKFEPKWILENQSGGKSSVIEEVLAAIAEKYSKESVVMVKKEFHQCSLIVATDDFLTADAVISFLREHILSVADAEIVLTINEMETAELEKTLMGMGNKLDGEQREFFINEFNLSFEDTSENQEVQSDEKETAANCECTDVNSLIGMDSLKEFFSEVAKWCRSGMNGE